MELRGDSGDEEIQAPKLESINTELYRPKKVSILFYFSYF